MNDTNRSSLRTYLIYIFCLLSAIILTSTVLFYQFEKGDEPPHPRNYWDSFWWTMVTMTTIGYGDIFPKSVAGRILAVALMFAGIGTLGVSTAAIAAYFIKTDKIEELRIRRLHGHVVICGLGRKGLLLTKAFRERGVPVIAIEKSDGNDLVQAAREHGATVFLGDATEREMLARARVTAAKYLVSVCGSDGVNAEVAAHAREMAGHRHSQPLTCATHIVDSELWYLLRRWELSTSDGFRLQFFNVYDSGARAMLRAYPPFHDPGNPASPPPNHAPHLLVVGAGRLGRSVVVHAARLWRDQRPGEDDRLKVTIIDEDTTHVLDRLHLRHPGFDRICEVTPLTLDTTSPEYHRAQFLFDEQGHCIISAIYICINDDTAGLSAALALLHRLRRHHVPIVVRMTEDAGLAELLHGVRATGHGFETLHAFGLLERTCHPDLVLGGTNETLARAIHEKYLEDQARAGDTPTANPALVPWGELPEEIKESNRRQASHIGLKLKAIGCDIAPLTEWESHAFTFTPEEIELMAAMEHQRWLEERKAAGWTLGPRDPVKKTNPLLVPWEQLDDKDRLFNRGVIQDIPVLLSRAGFQIYRLHQG